MGISDVSTMVGTTVSLTTERPSDYVASAYATLNFTPVGEITDIPEFGRAYEVITHNALERRGSVYFKSFFNEGDIQLPFVTRAGDAGQAIARSSADSQNEVLSVKFEYLDESGTNSQIYFESQVFSFTDGGNQNSLRGGNIRFMPDAGTVVTAFG